MLKHFETYFIHMHVATDSSQTLRAACVPNTNVKYRERNPPSLDEELSWGAGNNTGVTMTMFPQK